MADANVFHTRINDLDRPLHRIFPVWLLEEALRLKRLTLVKPCHWPDKREDPCSTFVLRSQNEPGRPTQEVAAYLAPAWAQCWSYEADSDVLLRAYSRVVLDPISQRNTDPANEGARVTTTARKLIAVAEQWAARLPDYSFFLAPVIYEDEAEFGKSLVNKMSGPNGPRVFGTPRGRADSLFVKRSMFRQEDEVRLLCVGSGRCHEGDKLKHLGIDPNQLFDEIRIDPRLMVFERMERESKMRSRNFNGKFVEDAAYIRTFVEVIMPCGWPDPE